MSTSYCTFGVINILILIIIVSIGINIGSIVKSGRALEAYPDSFFCPHETSHLHTFLIGGVVSSTLTLLTTTTTCVFTVLVWTLTKDFVHGGMFVGMTAFNGVFSAFQLVWAILGTLWRSRADSCEIDYYAALSNALDFSLYTLWSSYVLGIVPFFLALYTIMFIFPPSDGE